MRANPPTNAWICSRWSGPTACAWWMRSCTKHSRCPPTLRELVVNNAEGNPFYIEELVKMLIEDGVIQKGEESWQVDASRLERVRVPPTLAGVLQARFDSLPANERLLLQRAAVIGRIFWDHALSYLSQNIPDGNPTPQPGDLASAGSGIWPKSSIPTACPAASRRRWKFPG